MMHIRHLAAAAVAMALLPNDSAANTRQLPPTNRTTHTGMGDPVPLRDEAREQEVERIRAERARRKAEAWAKRQPKERPWTGAPPTAWTNRQQDEQ